MDAGITTGLTMGGAGIASVTLFDAMIDRTMHDHRHWSYRHGGVPTRVLASAAGLAGLGALALHVLPTDRDDRRTARHLGYGAGAAFAGTLIWRLGWGMAMSPLRPLHLNLGDVVGNSINRSHMMGMSPSRRSWPALWPIFDGINRLQGHGPIDRRVFEIARPWPK